MLAKLSKRGELAFTDDEINWAIRITRAHPWRLQVLASHLFEARQRGKPDRTDVERLYRQETESGKRPSHRLTITRGSDDRRQRLAPVVVILTTVTLFSSFFFVSVNNLYGVYFALLLAVVTVALIGYAYWPWTRRST